MYEKTGRSLVVIFTEALNSFMKMHIHQNTIKKSYSTGIQYISLQLESCFCVVSAFYVLTCSLQKKQKKTKTKKNIPFKNGRWQMAG